MPCLLVLWTAVTAFAERVWSGTPIPRSHRVFCSAVTLFPIAVLMSVASYVVVRLWQTSSRERLVTFIVVVLGITALGSFLASWDEMNDELWSPCSEAAVFATLIMPAALLTLDRRIHWSLRIVLAILACAVMWFPVGMLTCKWQMWGRSLGLPTTW
jgi:hypothetical protein